MGLFKIHLLDYVIIGIVEYYCNIDYVFRSTEIVQFSTYKIINLKVNSQCYDNDGYKLSSTQVNKNELNYSYYINQQKLLIDSNTMH